MIRNNCLPEVTYSFTNEGSIDFFFYFSSFSEKRFFHRTTCKKGQKDSKINSCSQLLLRNDVKDRHYEDKLRNEGYREEEIIILKRKDNLKSFLCLLWLFVGSVIIRGNL